MFRLMGHAETGIFRAAHYNTFIYVFLSVKLILLWWINPLSKKKKSNYHFFWKPKEESQQQFSITVKVSDPE